MESYEKMSKSDAALIGITSAFCAGVIGFAVYKGHKTKKDMVSKLSVIEKYYEKTDKKFVPFSELDRETYKIPHKSFGGGYALGKKIKNRKIFRAVDSVEQFSYKGRPIFQYGHKYEKVRPVMVQHFIVAVEIACR